MEEGTKQAILFSSGCRRVLHSIETNMVTIHHNRWAKAETQMGGYNLSRLTCAPRQTSQWVTELPRCTVEGNFRIWKAMKGLREVKWGRGSGREGDVMGTIVPRLMNVLCRWLGCGRKSPVWEVSSYQWYAVTWANWQSCPKSLQEEEAEQAPNPEETDCKNMEDEGAGPSSLIKEKGGASPFLLKSH